MKLKAATQVYARALYLYTLTPDRDTHTYIPVLVQDELSEGVPIAWAIMNREDTLMQVNSFMH